MLHQCPKDCIGSVEFSTSFICRPDQGAGSIPKHQTAEQTEQVTLIVVTAVKDDLLLQFLQKLLDLFAGVLFLQPFQVLHCGVD